MSNNVAFFSLFKHWGKVVFVPTNLKIFEWIFKAKIFKE